MTASIHCALPSCLRLLLRLRLRLHLTYTASPRLHLASPRPPKPAASTPMTTGGRRRVLTRANWDIIWKAYPRGDAADIKKEIGGSVDAAWVANTCVVRVSRAFNLLAKETRNKKWYVPKKFDIEQGSEKMGLTIKGGDKKRYALRVAEFHYLLKAWLGEAPIKIYPKIKVGLKEKQPGSKRDVFVDNYYEGLKNKRGIIMFDTRGVWGDATGHFDVFDENTGGAEGHMCGSKCYWKEAKYVWLWPAQ